MTWWRGRKGDTSPDAWREHERRAGRFVAELDARLLNSQIVDSEVSAAGREWMERLWRLPEDVAGSALLLMVRRCRDREVPFPVLDVLADHRRRRWSITPSDALIAARIALDLPDEHQAGWALRTVEILLSRSAAAEPFRAEEDIALIKELVSSVGGRVRLNPGDREATRKGLLRLLGASPAVRVDTSVIVPVDGWAAAVLAELVVADDAAAVNAVLRHCALAAGSRPAKKWLAETARLLESAPAIAVVRLMLEALADAEPIPAPARWGDGDTLLLVDERNADVARAAAWAAIDVDAPWVVPVLRRVAERGIKQSGLTGWMSGDKVPNACILALGAIATPEAIAALRHLGDTTKHNGFRTRIATALTVCARAAGLTPGQLVEQNVPDAGLDPQGTATVAVGTTVAEIALTDELKVTVSWKTGDDQWAAKPPDGADDAVKQIKLRVRETRTAVAGERRRLEGLFAADRTWPVEDWRRYYLDHPITGPITRRLIWIFTRGPGDAAVTGIPAGTGVMTTLAGERPLPESGTVVLWHPARAGTDEVNQWRTWLLADPGRRQPFKQAFREIYLLTPAELETGTYSNRYAAHILQYQQLYALFKERGWTANYLGPYDGGFEGRARHEYPDAGITAVFEHDAADLETGAYTADLCGTDRVWFHRTGDRNKTALPLDEVPPLVFSEAMRDVDLFVGVTSIAADPAWADRGDDPHRDYWLRASASQLSATAEVRSAVLAHILPTMRIADRVELTDRHVRVRGNVATYKIHIGSANISIEPDDRYLCIVPKRRGRTARPLLPFDGDETLSVILSKIVLLAADDKITDPTILRQIRPRSPGSGTG